MSERYWVTGVQLGILKAFSKGAVFEKAVGKLVDEIIDKQFIGNFRTIEEQTNFELAISLMQDYIEKKQSLQHKMKVKVK